MRKRLIKAVVKGGRLVPLEDIDLRDGEVVTLLVQEDLVEVARRVRALVRSDREPSEILSEERKRFET
ncbi:antitoxin [Ignicoccus pacificus DSM 13166]|uniref:Antitoxin n=1 Tax=Ignicoccus pacificus DSM 13166 TaxID=940294 RepID=A0A977PKI8_9CREN|nr:antitoxin [Ignicoccus pacificus DSM 13166]